MRKALYRWLPLIFGCHCRSDRSFFLNGRQFPLCARCTGELAGILLSIVLFWFYRPTIPVSVLIMLPLIADGFVQRLTAYESTNIRRLITGLLFGLGLASIFAQTTEMAFQFGVAYGRTLRT